MANYLNPFSGRQFIDASGTPYSGAKLFIYQAGTSTKITTYKDSAGASSHTNPIVLNSKGEPADGAGASQPIWQSSLYAAKLVLAPANDTDPPASAISTWDNISGINNIGDLIDQRSDTGAVEFTLHEFHEDRVANANTDFGATGDGAADDTAELQALFDLTGTVELKPNASYYISSSLEIDTTLFVNGNGATIVPSSDALLEPIKIGANALVNRGGIRDLFVERASYSGATENIGIAIYDAVSFTFENVECLRSKYNWALKSGTGQRVGYCYFHNIGGNGGLYNLYFNPTSTGYTNENVFVGGRMIDTADTTTHVYITAGATNKPNHNKFFGMSCEGTGDQAIYCAGDNNFFNFIRTEGTWSNDDIVLAGDYNMVITSRQDVTVTDSGTGNQYITYGQGWKMLTNQTNKTTLTVERTGANSAAVPALKIVDNYSSSGNSYGIEWRYGRDNATSYLFKAIRESDDAIRSYLTANGIMDVATSYKVAGTQVVGAQATGWTAGTGTANKAAFATYAGQTVSAAYVQAEAQATDDAVKANSQRIKAIEDAIRTHGLIN